MQENLVISLLHKQLSDTLESKDKELLMDWLANSEKNAQMQKDLTQIWELSKNYTPSFAPDVNKSFEKFNQRIKADGATEMTPRTAKVIKLSPIKAWMRYAAAAVILLGAVMVWQFSNANTPNMEMASTIDNATRHLSLTDGSTVVLNEKSKLNFPDKFVGDSRIVELDGHAFFDITPDSKKPFIVKGGAADVKVIGTSFSFNTNNQNGLMEVEVVDGVVELIPVGSEDKLTLTRKEKGFYDPINKVFLAKEQLKVTNAKYFIDNRYSFNETKFLYVFNVLSKVYDVEFSFAKDYIAECEFTSPLEFENSIEGVIEIIEKVNVNYNLTITETSDDKYLIASDPCY